MSLLSKFCRTCRETKPVSEFIVDRSAKDGLRYECKPCVKERRVRLGFDKGKKVGGQPGKRIMPHVGGNPFDLAILLTLKRRTDPRTWTVAEAKRLLTVYVRLRQKNIGMDEALEQAKVEGKAITSAKSLVYELTKAAKAGMTLEAYFEAGRPFQNRVPNKTLVKAKHA